MSECDATPNITSRWLVVLGAMKASGFYKEIDLLRGGIMDEGLWLLFYITDIKKKQVVGLKKEERYIVVIEEGSAGEKYVVFSKDEKGWSFFRGEVRKREGNVIKSCTVTEAGRIVHGDEFLERLAVAGNVDYKMAIDGRPQPKLVIDNPDPIFKEFRETLGLAIQGKGPWVTSLN